MLWLFQSFLIDLFCLFCGLWNNINVTVSTLNIWTLGCTEKSEIWSHTIVLNLLRHVVIHHVLYSWEIQTFGSDIGSYQNILLSPFERLNGFSSLLLVCKAHLEFIIVVTQQKTTVRAASQPDTQWVMCVAAGTQLVCGWLMTFALQTDWDEWGSTFSSVYSHGLHTFEQQILVYGIHVCFLLCK